MNKKVIHVVLFILIFNFLFSGLNNILGYHDNVHTATVFKQFYDLPKDSIDVISIGSSSIHEFLVPPIVYDETGIASYALSTGNMRFNTFLGLMKECEQLQDPNVYLIDIRPLAGSDYSENSMRRVTDNMRWSFNRLESIKYICSNLKKYHPEFDIDYSSCVFPFKMYHSRWTDLTSEDFSGEQDCYLGYIFNGNRLAVFDEKTITARLDAEPQPISDESKQYLDDFLNYCDTLNKTIIFINTPCCMGEDVFAKYNYIGEIIKKRGYPYVDLNHKVKEMNLDYSSDWGDGLHVNNVGAVKFSRYIANWLASDFDLPDHRGDKRYKEYERISRIYRERFLEKQISMEIDFTSYLSYLSKLDKEKYSVFMAVKDIQGFALSAPMIEQLKTLGFDQTDKLLEWKYHSFVGVTGEGGVLCQKIGNEDEPEHFEGIVCNRSIKIDSMVLNGGNKAVIEINGDNYALNIRGFNIVVLDNVDNQVIDSVAFDTHNEKIPCHRQE